MVLFLCIWLVISSCPHKTENKQRSKRWFSFSSASLNSLLCFSSLYSNVTLSPIITTTLFTGKLYSYTYSLDDYSLGVTTHTFATTVLKTNCMPLYTVSLSLALCPGCISMLIARFKSRRLAFPTANVNTLGLYLTDKVPRDGSEENAKRDEVNGQLHQNCHLFMFIVSLWIGFYTRLSYAESGRAH